MFDRASTTKSEQQRRTHQQHTKTHVYSTILPVQIRQLGRFFDKSGGFPYMQRVMRHFSRLFVLLSLLMSVGCGAASPEDLEKSQKEFELGATLHGEGNFPSAIEHLKRAIELDDENAEAHVLLGVIRFQRNEYTAATSHVGRGVELLEAEKHHGSTLAEARNILGLLHYHQQRYDQAEKALYKSAVDEMNRAPHLAWGNLGLVRSERGDIKGAEEALTEAIRIQPRFCVGYLRLAKLRFDQKSYEMAEKLFTKALEADEMCANSPSLQSGWRLRGETRARLGYHSDAVADFERCIELGADSEEGKSCQRILDSQQ